MHNFSHKGAKLPSGRSKSKRRRTKALDSIGQGKADLWGTPAMFDNPILVLLVFAGALYLAKLWWDDVRAARDSEPHPNALPGASLAPTGALVVAAIGAIFLVGLETAGEVALGVSGEQSTLPAIFLLAMIGAGILEEVIFRGFLVVTKKGKLLLYGSILAFSLLFTLAHTQYYTEIPEGASWMEFQFTFDTKSLWTLSLLFLNSLWFYAVRFFPLNPTQSLLPCFVAHISSNVAVFVVKAAQGHIVGLY
jgi:membrane protease YdiL (CAAX protease family)